LFSKFKTVICNCNSQLSAYARVITTTQEKNNTLLNQIKKKQFEASKGEIEKNGRTEMK